MTQYAILAAGKGSRLASAGVPKPLVCIDGRPLIVRLIDAFASAGAEQVTVSVRPDNHALKDFLSNEDFAASIDIVEVEAETPLQSLKAVLEALKPAPCIIATADTAVAPEAFRQFAQAYAAMPASQGLLAVSVPADASVPGLYITGDAMGRVTALSGTPTGSTPRISAGIYAFDAAAGRRALRSAMAAGAVRLRDFQLQLVHACDMLTFDIGTSVDVDTPSDLACARKIFTGNAQSK